MPTSHHDAAREPVRELVEHLRVEEAELLAECERTLTELAESLQQLDGWGDRLARDQATRDAAERLRQAERQAADELRRRLEHDLSASRARVLDLERQLQQRTEELLAAQAANNALAAELQSMSDAWLQTGGAPGFPTAAEDAPGCDAAPPSGLESTESVDTRQRESDAAGGGDAGDGSPGAGDRAPRGAAAGSVAERFARLRRKRSEPQESGDGAEHEKIASEAA